MSKIEVGTLTLLVGELTHSRIWVSSLTDATGPVDVTIKGDTATIRYIMTDGHLSIVQQLQLQPDGKTLANHVTAKKFGLKFGRVDGEVRKLD